MTIDVDTFKAKDASKDTDLGVAAGAAAIVLGATQGGSQAIEITGIVVAGAILAVAVLGRFIVRRGGVDAAGIVVATEAAGDDGAPDAATAIELAEAERDPDLSQLVVAAGHEQVGMQIPPVLTELDEFDGEVED